MRLQNGFTLIEVMIVLAIIALLASVAFPSYQDYVIRGNLTEGISDLADARIRMEQYYQDNRTYLNADDALPACSAETDNFVFTCVVADDSYTITATGKGIVADFAFTINELNTRRTTDLKGDWGTAPMNCWVTKKGQAC